MGDEPTHVARVTRVSRRERYSTGRRSYSRETHCSLSKQPRTEVKVLEERREGKAVRVSCVGIARPDASRNREFAGRGVQLRMPTAVATRCHSDGDSL